MFEPKPHAVVASRYRLAREIGRGGMGAVWEAFDLELEAPCALKFILNQDTKPAEVRARFLREARAVARLQSPHVVSVRSVGEWEGALYIAMELLVGETLFERLTRTTTLSVRETARLVDQVASVLAIAHAAGIVHRDLKPENIWLWSQGELLVKVLDFGVAKHVLDDGTLLKTATGVLVGTPYYMSPEQAAGDRQVDHRSDLWSLAMIAAESLSGLRPFQGTGLGQVLASIISGAPPDITQLYPPSNPALRTWWARATAKDPSARYDSAPTLAREFATALGLGGDLASASTPHHSADPNSPEKPPAATSSLSPLVAGARATQPLGDTSDVWQTATPQRAELTTHTADPSTAAAGPATASRNDASQSSPTAGYAAGERKTVGGAQSEASDISVAAPIATGTAAPLATAPRSGRIGLVLAATAAIVAIGVGLGRGRSPESATLTDAASSSGGETVAPRAAQAIDPGSPRTTEAVGTTSSPAPLAEPSAGPSPTSPAASATPALPDVTARSSASSPAVSTARTPDPSSPGLSGAPRAATNAAKPVPTPKPKIKPDNSEVDRRIGF